MGKIYYLMGKSASGKDHIYENLIQEMLSLIFFHGLRGVGIGTVISAVLVGPIINIVNRVFTFQHRIQALALSRDGR